MIMLCFLCFTVFTGQGQAFRHLTSADGNCNHCYGVASSNDMIDTKLLKIAPYNNIFHLGIKWKNDVVRYGVASFISKDVLVTARHCVDKKENLEYIELTLPSFNNQWIVLKPEDYKIYYYTPQLQSFESDIALIRVTNKSKLKMLYRSHFKLETKTIHKIENLEINVSGYPFNKFAINSIHSDTLVNRVFSGRHVELNSTNTMAGFPACLCSGDSGGPVWYKRQGSFYLFAVSQGSKAGEAGFKNSNLNISVLISSKSKWFRSIIEGNKQL